MFSFKNLTFERASLLSLTFCVVLVSCISWGRIITEASDSNAGVEQLTSQVKTAEQIKQQAVVFSGVMVVLLRHLPISNED